MSVGPNSPYTRLDQNHITQRVFDETTDRLRVDAEVTATIGTIECIINAASGDNIAITSQDGTKTLTINADGSTNSVVTATDLDIRNLLFATDKVDVSGSTIILPDHATETKQDTQITLLTGIDTKLTTTNSELVIANGHLVDIKNNTDQIETNQSSQITLQTSANTKLDTIITELQNSEPVKISGTNDGTLTGTEYGFVNNLKLQILASDDRDEQYTYADFGTKDERITRVEYSSATFLGFTVRRDFNYTLVGNKYRRDSSIWSIV